MRPCSRSSLAGSGWARREVAVVVHARRHQHRRATSTSTAQRPGTTVAGLCDRGEVRFVAGAAPPARSRRSSGRRRPGGVRLLRLRRGPRGRADPRPRGPTTVVERDRARGRAAASCGPSRSQPFQRARPLHDQLHRFAGTQVGPRRSASPPRLAAALDLDAVPAPAAGRADLRGEPQSRSGIPVIRRPECALYFRLIEISTAVNGSS